MNSTTGTNVMGDRGLVGRVGQPMFGGAVVGSPSLPIGSWLLCPWARHFTHLASCQCVWLLYVCGCGRGRWHWMCSHAPASLPQGSCGYYHSSPPPVWLCVNEWNLEPCEALWVPRKGPYKSNLLLYVDLYKTLMWQKSLMLSTQHPAPIKCQGKEKNQWINVNFNIMFSFTCSILIRAMWGLLLLWIFILLSPFEIRVIENGCVQGLLSGSSQEWIIGLQNPEQRSHFCHIETCLFIKS